MELYEYYRMNLQIFSGVVPEKQFFLCKTT